jgi:hypothetical protein
MSRCIQQGKARHGSDARRPRRFDSEGRRFSSAMRAPRMRAKHPMQAASGLA